ncbi:uncharacterized protein LOC143343514 [Colletes latitarsis]|uniref:uncharacterized protein LOC143343514 n=1 Tax=Colletes latitarsis TaxID=2605962 RepID=UPI00403540DE
MDDGTKRGSKLSKHSNLEQLEEDDSKITRKMIEEPSIGSPEHTKDVSKGHNEIRKSKIPRKPEKSYNKEIQNQPNVPSTPKEKIAKFLREKSLSQSLIATLLKVGFTDEFLRLLKAIGFVEEDIEKLEKLWDLEKNREDTDSSASLPSSSDEYLSPDGMYLKNSLSKPLSRGMREIVSKKPFDPVEYLGHWLLNYKICEERCRRRREFELELMIERERLSLRDLEDKISVSMEHEEGEEEEYVDDWNFLDYE